MRQLGDNYVRSEFKLHKKATKPEYLSAFFVEWEKYLHELLVTARTKESLSMGAIVDQSAAKHSSDAFSYGKDLPMDLASSLADDQRKQLENLKREAEKLGRHDN